MSRSPALFQDTVVKYFVDHIDDSVQEKLMAALWNGGRDHIIQSHFRPAMADDQLHGLS
jgi:hypothetical protein